MVVPANRPETIPVPEPTLAIVPELLAHVPPAGVLVSVVVVPGQMLVDPAMAAGTGFTVTVTALEHPVPS